MSAREEAQSPLTMPIRGLTLWRPWGWSIFDAEADKDAENRGPRFPAPKPGAWLAIHNGKVWSAEAVEFMAKLGLTVPPEEKHPVGFIIGVVRVAAVTRGTALHESRWYMGATGLWLADKTAITPVACRGAQGLWALPPEVLQQVRRNYAAARGLAKEGTP